MKIKKHIISSLILLSSFTNLNAQIKNINTDNEKKFEEYLGLEIMKNTYKFSKKDENDAKHYYQRFMQIKGNKKLDFLELMRNYQAGISPENYTYPIDTEKPNAIVYIAQYDHFIKNKTEIGNSYKTAEYFSFLQDLNIYYDLEIKVIRNKDEILKNLSNKKKQSLDLICFSAHTTNDKKKQKLKSEKETLRFLQNKTFYKRLIPKILNLLQINVY